MPTKQFVMAGDIKSPVSTQDDSAPKFKAPANDQTTIVLHAADGETLCEITVTTAEWRAYKAIAKRNGVTPGELMSHRLIQAALERGGNPPTESTSYTVALDPEDAAALERIARRLEVSPEVLLVEGALAMIGSYDGPRADGELLRLLDVINYDDPKTRRRVRSRLKRGFARHLASIDRPALETFIEALGISKAETEVSA